MGIVHVVMFEPKPEISAEELQEICDGAIALKDNCIHSETQKPYIKSFIGGRQNSPEGLANGMTHVFVAEFENEEDRHYYLNTDPAHHELSQKLRKIAAKAQVVDFTPGVF